MDLNIHSQGTEYGIPYVKGNLRNLKVRITKSKIKIEGSIHVFCKGNNLESMSFHEFKESLNLLEQMLQLPIENARVSRIDFSGNILLKHPVEAYFTYFGQKSRFRKQVMDNGIMYLSEELGLIFYDKIKELKHKRESIPEYFQGKNVLRFEMRFMRKLGKSFQVPELTVGNLIEPSFFNQLCQRWRQEFKSVTMEMISPIGLNPTGSKPKLLEQLAIRQLHQIGFDNFLNEISAWQTIGEITKKEAYDIRKFLKENVSEQYPLAENELIRELNQKIKVAARFEV
ncbi:MAG: phage/plasmid replication protein [Prolixibacteraceae bacterium]